MSWPEAVIHKYLLSLQTDIFSPMTMKYLANQSLFNISVTISDIKGRCYTIKWLPEQELIDLEVGIRSGLKLQLFLHDEGEQFWLVVGNFPFQVGSVIIDTTDVTGPQVIYFFSLKTLDVDNLLP